ncbi:MAG: hemerythrin domain-containing protein [Bacillota bacterium]
MQNEQTHCGMMGNNITELCAPLQTLKKEHKPLRREMEELYEIAFSIEKSDPTTEWKSQMLTLRQKVIQFANNLDLHSEKEEGVLFPLMANYIGREAGPIAVMEYEHEQAKINLKKFLDLTSNLKNTVNYNEAKEMAGVVILAYLILSEHFMKEENVLFPMAESILSIQEKEELRVKFEEK